MTYDPTVKMAAIDTNGQTPTIDDPLNPGTPVQNPAWIPTFIDNPMQFVVQDLGQSTRTIAQLISSSDVDPSSPTYNPAAAAAMEALGGHAVATSNTVVGSSVTAEMPNPGILGGVPYNEWFVAFGQFFDHGLDFISKGAGYVLIPISPNDPLYDASAAGPMANMMMLSRASLSNGPGDFYLDPATGNMHLMNGLTPQFNNNTGLLIDQSQTYGSHVSVNALVRQYDSNGIVTGALITGNEDGNGDAHDLGKWTDMQANALRIGIELIDMDVLDAPMIKADAIGRITFDVIPVGTLPSGMGYRSDETLAQMAARTNVAAATLEMYDPFERHPAGTFDAAGNDIGGTVMQSNQGILADIAHGASPLSAMGMPLPPASGISDFTGLIPGVHYYDDAALARHYVSGDGRVNENAGLTAVHHVFHEEHNIQVQQIKDQVTAIAQDLFDAEMTASGNASAAQAAADAYKADWEASPGIWDGEKLYQAARIITESEYNHIAIDQYVTGLYPMLPEFVSYSSDINMSISLEFAQAVFRLGHSQLRETVQVALPDDNGLNPGEPGYIAGNYTEVDLFDAFLNPAVYDAHGAAAIALGLINQTGNEIDEFVTSALQQSLVGVPLDLAALNLARSRDVGLPTLNELRQQVFDGLTQNTNNNANGSGLAPYTSWADFGGHLRTPESLVNFIAAYGRDDATFGLQAARSAYENGSMTLQDLRANAQVIIDAAADTNHALHDEAVMFLRGTGAPVFDTGTGQWQVNANNGGDQGFWDIDLWIGGLAEQPLFDGPLGTTFSLVMLDFAQRMQDGDRFYYLYRMPVGHHLGDQIIGEQFADLVMRTTGLDHINGDVFGQASATFILDGDTYDNARDGTGVDDAYGTNDYFNAIYETLPGSVTPFVLANSSFEAQKLGNGLGTTNTNGTYLSGSPDSWTVTQGGIWAPDTETDLDPDFVVDPAGMLGSQVAYINGTGTLSQDVDATAKEGATYALSFALGNREDQPTSSVHAYLYAGATLLADTVAQNADDGWINVTFDTSNPMAAYGPIDAAVAGQQLRIVIHKLGDATAEDAGATQVLIDNVRLTESTPGGSANDGHIVVAGLEGNDYIIGGLGDDTIYGDAGNDLIEGAQGNDHLYGGDGDDWITDYENDDFIAGGAGNDYISAGPGVLDTIHGNEGDDELHGGDGIDEVFGDDGDDRLYGEGDTDLMMGGEGNDYMEGGDSVDEMFGGNGNDWMRGGVGDDNINGGSGNDLMEGGLGAVANDGDRLNGDTLPGALPVIEWNGDGTEGDMDIVSYEDVPIAVFASLQTANANATSSNLLDTYALDEGIVGSAQDDELEGADAGGTAGNGPRNQLIGGAGNDRLIGLGDTDWLFGGAAVVRNDLWVDLDATRAYEDGSLYSDTARYEVIENWYGTGETRVRFLDTGELGHILGDNGTDGTADVAVYRGNMADYEVSFLEDGRVMVVDTRPVPADPQAEPHDGTDYLWGIETIEFADGTMNITPTPPVLDLHAADSGNLRDEFSTSSFANSDGTIAWTSAWTETGDDGTPGNGQIQIDGGFNGTNQLRLADAGNGASIQRSFDLSGATSAELSFDYSESSFDFGESVVAAVSFDGGTVWHDLAVNLNASTNNGGTFTVDLASLLGTSESFGPDAIIRFTANTSGNGNGTIRIDNLNVDIGIAVNDGSNDYAATFTEDSEAVAIASGPSITDDSPTMTSARIVLTNAKDGDVLHENGIGGDGIAGSIDTSVPGVITLTMSGEASLAAYQAAIAAVTFENSSQAPDETPRVIEVTVNDGSFNSNVAVSTIDVVGVVDPVNTAPETVVVNFSGAVQVPTWALLANDFGDTALTVTGASEVGNTSGFSVNPFTTGDTVVSLTKTTGNNRTFSYTATDGVSSDTQNVSVGTDTFGTVSGSNGADIVIGDNGGDTFDAGGGNDIVFAGGGDDTIEWSAGSNSNDGRDYVDGGAEGSSGDTFVVNGNSTAENFVIYSRLEADAAGIAGLRPETEIVVTRNGAVIAELVDIEEIRVNTGWGADNVTVVGDFSPTQLNYNTITINDDDGGDEVDISALTSGHRIVFNTDTNGNVTGDVRPQDVVNRSGTPSDGDAEGSDDSEAEAPQGDGASSTGGSVGLAGPDFDDLGAPRVGGNEADVLVGGDEADLVIAGGGDDVVLGGGGDDMVFGDAGDDRVLGGDGDDWVVDGEGDGSDYYWGGKGSDTLDYSGHTGDVDVDLGSGIMGHGQVTVGTEHDVIFGFENVATGSGDDTITANSAVNVMDGGDGDNVFVFRSATHADGDQIVGFNIGDKIDLSGIDADQTTAGHQSFVLFTNGGLNAAGQLNVTYEMHDDGEHTIVSGNVSGGDDADFEIDITGHHALAATDSIIS
ncbi:peroxidase family protein [Maritimibacter sp. DP1N21-5]|uniref:peroxidase family protein n=1 Tax=Maritimibacter sp. DP1N21-5 TaxID=2836867 RepID=UPI001C47A774